MKASRIAICALIAAGFSTPTFGAWEIEASKDRLTDKTTTFATVAAKEARQSIKGALEIGCLNGRVSMAVVLSERLSRGNIGAAYRVNENREQLRILTVFSDPYRVRFMEMPISSKDRRFRIQLQPSGSPALFYDFDIAGIDDVFRKVRC